MSDREEFEKWYDEATNCNHGVAYYVGINDRYCFTDIEIAWQAWQSARANGTTVPMKPIAESKVRQLGGDVCGVLVRTQDSEVMAVSEHGCCTRLDAGVMGLVEPAGMSERELFEQRFPVPAGIYWNEISEQYDALPGTAGFDDVEIYHGKWQAWQAARAQPEPSSGVQSSECSTCNGGGGTCEPEGHSDAMLFVCPDCDGSGDATESSAGVPSRNELISLLMATQNESEGVTADLILGMIQRKREGEQ